VRCSDATARAHPYLFDKDSGPTTACTGAGADNWPPIVADGPPTGGGGDDASQVGTADGILPNQVTYHGHLLHSFAGDETPGDTNGISLSGRHAVKPAGASIARLPDIPGYRLGAWYYDHRLMVSVPRSRQSRNVSDDWLDRGHEANGSRLATVFARTPSDLHEVDGTRAGSPSSWLAGPVSAAIVALVVLVGSAGAVYAIRESLFPNLGASTSASVWRSPASPAEPEPAPPAMPSSTTTPPTTTAATNSVTTTTAAPVERTVTVGPGTTIERGDDSDHSGASNSGSDDSGTSNSGSGSGNSGSDDSGAGNSGTGSDDSGTGSDDSGSDDSGSDDSGSDDSGAGSDDSGTTDSGSGSGNSGSGSGSGSGLDDLGSNDAGH
jgi:hypothetical protein